MNDIPNFADALEQFRRFLADNGHATKLLWVFREDIWQTSQTEVYVRCPPSSGSLALAEKVFDEGRASGLVQLTAIARLDDTTVATVWFPKRHGEEVQGWDCGMKMSICQPFPYGKTVESLCWYFYSRRRHFIRFQTVATFIGTKEWAASERSIGKTWTS